MKSYTQKDVAYVLGALELLSEAERERLYEAYAHGTAYLGIEEKRKYTWDSIRESLSKPPEDGETPMHTAFRYLYDRTRHWLGFSQAAVIIRTYHLIATRKPGDQHELAVACRALGEMQLYNPDPTPDTMREAEKMLAQSLILYNGMNLSDPNKKAGRANTLSSTAVLLMTQGKDSEAESLLIEAKRVFRDLSYRGREEWRPYYAGSLINLADLYSRIGKVADAIHYYQHAANVFEKCKLGDPTYIRFALDHIIEKTHILAVKKSEN